MPRGCIFFLQVPPEDCERCGCSTCRTQHLPWISSSGHTLLRVAKAAGDHHPSTEDRRARRRSALVFAKLYGSTGVVRVGYWSVLWRLFTVISTIANSAFLVFGVVNENIATEYFTRYLFYYRNYFFSENDLDMVSRVYCSKHPSGDVVICNLEIAEHGVLLWVVWISHTRRGSAISHDTYAWAFPAPAQNQELANVSWKMSNE